MSAYAASNWSKRWPLRMPKSATCCVSGATWRRSAVITVVASRHSLATYAGSTTIAPPRPISVDSFVCTRPRPLM